MVFSRWVWCEFEGEVAGDEDVEELEVVSLRGAEDIVVDFMVVLAVIGRPAVPGRC